MGSVPAEKQADQRALAGTRRADDSHLGAGRDVEVDRGENVASCGANRHGVETDGDSTAGARGHGGGRLGSLVERVPVLQVFQVQRIQVAQWLQQTRRDVSPCRQVAQRLSQLSPECGQLQRPIRQEKDALDASATGQIVEDQRRRQSPCQEELEALCQYGDGLEGASGAQPLGEQ